MSRTRKLLAGTLGVLALSVGAAPLAQAQPLPGGSVTLPPIEPIAMPVPMGSTAGQLPALPFPAFWQDAVPPPPPSAPRFVASNWVIAYGGCPAANQWAYAQDGTKLWCTYLDRTDARLWAPYTADVPWTPDFRFKPRTEVANSLAGKPCQPVGATAIDPSNGQEAYCDWRRIDSDVPVWQYEPGS